MSVSWDVLFICFITFVLIFESSESAASALVNYLCFDELNIFEKKPRFLIADAIKTSHLETSLLCKTVTYKDKFAFLNKFQNRFHFSRSDFYKGLT